MKTTKKKKYFRFKNTLKIEPKNFKHHKITIWCDVKSFDKLYKEIGKLEDKFINKKNIRKGKKSPTIISTSWQDPSYKWKLAGPLNTPQTHNLIVGGLKRNDAKKRLKRIWESKPNIDLINAKINEKEKMYFDRDKNQWHYQTEKFELISPIIQKRYLN